MMILHNMLHNTPHITTRLKIYRLKQLPTPANRNKAINNRHVVYTYHISYNNYHANVPFLLLNFYQYQQTNK